MTRSTVRSFALALLLSSAAWADSAGGLAWEAPSGWTAEAKPMRVANYVVPAAGGGEPGELAVYYFGPGQGGSVQANVDRWIGQFRAPDGGSAAGLAQRSEKTVNGVAVTLLDLTGTYLFKAFPMAREATPKPGYRMLAAIAQGADAPIFFKLTAPSAAVAAAEGAFGKMIDSIRKE